MLSVTLLLEHSRIVLGYVEKLMTELSSFEK